MPDNEIMRIELFGRLRVVLGEREITHFDSRRASTLLAYLALFAKRSHPREVLAEMLWPDEESNVSRDRLRQVLSSLRQQLDTEAEQFGRVVIAAATDVIL